MTSPFRDIYDLQPQETQPTASPFSSIYGQQPQAVAGNNAIQAADRQDNKLTIAKIDELLKGTIGLAERERLTKMRTDLEDPGWYNKVTDPDRSIVENVGRGILHGVVNYGIMGAADLALAAGEIALPKAAEKFTGINTAREKVHELQSSWKEAFDPQGKAAAVGTVAGALVGGLKPFGFLNSVGFRALSKASPAAAKIVQRGLVPGATYLQRFAAHAIGSGAVDAVQAVDVLSRDDISDREKLKQLAIVVGTSGAAAAWGARHANKGELPLVADVAEKPLDGDAPTAPGQMEADAAIAKIAERKAAKKALSEMRFKARVAWSEANVGKSWEDLTKEERRAAFDDYVSKQAKPPEPPADGAAPAAVAPTDAEAPATPVTPQHLGSVETTGKQDAAQGVVEEAARPAPPPALPGVESPAPVQGVRIGIGEAPIARYISGDDALGATLREDIFNPGKLDKDGNPEVIARTGDKITPEVLSKIAGAGIERVYTSKGHVGLELTVQTGKPKSVTKTVKYDNEPEATDVFTRPGQESDREIIKPDKLVGEPVSADDLAHAARMDAPPTPPVDDLLKKLQEGMSDVDILKELGGEDLMSLAKTGEGTVGAGMDRSLLKKLGANLYKYGLGEVVTKEGIQNAVDAIRSVGQGGRVRVHISGKLYEFEDNGIGMSPKVAENQFMDVGGSSKTEGSAGGYGLAKVGLLANAEHFKMSTVGKDETGQKWLTTIEGTSDDWVNGTLQYTTNKVAKDMPTGTKLSIKLDEKANASEHNARDLVSRIQYFSSPEFTIEQKKNVYSWEKKTGEDVYEVPERPVTKKGETADLPNAKVIYTHAEKMMDRDEYGQIPVHVLNNGLYQFTMDLRARGRTPEFVIANVKSKVGVEAIDYPFTTSREELKSGVDADVKQYVGDIANRAAREEILDLIKGVLKAPQIKNSNLRVVDTEQRIPSELMEKITQAPSTTEFARAMQPAFQAIARVMDEAADIIGGGPHGAYVKFKFSGIGLGKKYLGVNISAKGIQDIAAGAKVDASSINQNIILVNPYNHFLEIDNAAYTRDLSGEATAVDNIDFMAWKLSEHTIGTIVHEIIHETARGHDVPFAGQLTRALGVVLDAGTEQRKNLTAMWKTMLQDPEFKPIFEDLQRAWKTAVDDKYKSISDQSKVDNGGGTVERPQGEGQPAKGDGDTSVRSRAGLGPEGGVRGSGPDAAGTSAEVGGAFGRATAAIKELKEKFLAATDPAEKSLALRKLQKAVVEAKTLSQQATAPVMPEGAVVTGPPSAGPAGGEHAVEAATQGHVMAKEGPVMDVPKGAEEPIPPKTAAELAKPPKAGTSKLGRTLDQIDNDIDKIDDLLDEGKISDAQATVRLNRLKDEKIALKKQMAKEQGMSGMTIKMPDTIDKPLHKFTAEQLSTTKRTLMGLIRDPANAPHKEALQAEFTRIADYEAARDRPPPGPVVLNMSPATVGGVVGFFGGYTQGNDEQERLKNAMYYGAAGMAIGYGLNRKLRAAADQAVPEYQKEIRKQVRSIEDRDFEKREGIMQRIRRIQRNWYAGTVRRSIGIEDASKAVGSADKPFFRNPGKMAELFGLSKHMADSWIFDRPRYWDDFSEVIELEAQGIQTIVMHADGDMRSVGDLMAARRALELASQPVPRKTGINLQAAALMVARTGQKVREASDMAREYGRALSRVGQLAGLLSEDVVKKWDVEYYAPMRRLFHGEVGDSPRAVNTKGQPTTQTGVAANQPFKKQKGGTLPLQNPMEALVDLTPRILRAAEFNRLATVFFDALANANPEVRKLIARPRISPSLPDYDALAVRLGKYVDEAGGQMSKEDAMQIVHTMSDRTLNVTDDIVHFYRNGKRESWQVAEPVARAFRSLQGSDMKAIMDGLELPIKVAEIARVGVTVNPWFILKQAFRDNWQFYQNGIYGTIPVYSNLKAFFYQGKGWWNIVKDADQVKLYNAFGGGGDTIADQGLQIIKGKVGLLEQIKAKPTTNKLELAVNQLKKMSIFEAYATLAAPIADAGRIGAYLHERGRGLAVADAVYNAKKAGANYNQKGDWAAIQGLNRMTLFLNAGLQSFDAAKDSFVKGPTAYISRAVVGITIPSVFLWAAYRDDEEIQEVRGTAAGKRAWPIRVGGKIVLVPKTQFDGHIWGTSVEAYLDKKYHEDPEAVHAMMAALFQDMAVNMMPTIGVVPISVWNNIDLNMGGPIVGGANSDLDIEYQYKDRTSTLARVVSKELAPAARSVNIPAVNTAVSPAGLDYLVRNLTGTLGAEVVSSISYVLDRANGASEAPGEELPFVSSAFGHYPSMNSGSIREFYNQATTAAQKAATLQHLAASDPESIETYIEANQKALMLAPMYGKVRNDLADMRKAIIDIKEAPSDVMSPDEKREIELEILTEMIDLARSANQVARQMEKEKD